MYDEASGVYLGTEHRLSNVYDKSSGIYLGEEAPKVPKHDEGTGSGILLSMLEEKRQEMYFSEDQHGSSMSLSEEKSSGSNEEVEVKVETPSLLERIKKVSIPEHLMPPPAEAATLKKTNGEDDNSRGAKKRQTKNSPRLLARSESYPRSASNASRYSADSESSTGVHGSQVKTINLGPYEGSLGENSLISRILKSTSSSQGNILPSVHLCYVQNLHEITSIICSAFCILVGCAVHSSYLLIYSRFHIPAFTKRLNFEHVEFAVDF